MGHDSRCSIEKTFHMRQSHRDVEGRNMEPAVTPEGRRIVCEVHMNLHINRISNQGQWQRRMNMEPDRTECIPQVQKGIWQGSLILIPTEMTMGSHSRSQTWSTRHSWLQDISIESRRTHRTEGLGGQTSQEGVHSRKQVQVHLPVLLCQEERWEALAHYQLLQT